MSNWFDLTLGIVLDRFWWWAVPTALFVAYLGVILFAYR